MRKLLLSVILVIPLAVSAQIYDSVITFYKNDYIENGIKIKTKIPFTNMSHMPNIRIEGFDGGTGTNIGLNISWIIEDYGGGYVNVTATASSWGGFTPPIYISKTNGFVSICLATTYGYSLYPRFKVSAYAEGMGESPSWFTNWQVVDSAVSGAHQTLVPYYNQLGGSLNLGGGLSATYITSSGAISGAGPITGTQVNSSRSFSGINRSAVSVTGVNENNGYYVAAADCHLMQNAYLYASMYGGANTTQLKPWGTKSQMGSAVIVSTKGKSGKAFNVAVDTTIASADDTLLFTDLFTISTAGRVGIGSSAPKELLEVNGNVTTSGNNKSFAFNTYNNSGKKYLATGYASAFTFDSTGMLYYANTSSSGSANGAATLNNVLAINKNGVMGIGTTAFGLAGYKLFVADGIRTRKVKIDQDTWSDYVFDATYKLPTLKEVEQFIAKNKHLPDVPSAAQMQKEGNDIGDTQRILLQKIEELTLYILQQDKKAQEQDKKIQQQGQRIEALEKGTPTN